MAKINKSKSLTSLPPLLGSFQALHSPDQSHHCLGRGLPSCEAWKDAALLHETLRGGTLFRDGSAEGSAFSFLPGT